MISVRFLTIILSTFVFIQPIWANKFHFVPNEDSNLEGYISIGLENNPDIQSVFSQWQSALENISVQFSLPDPQLTFTEYIDEVETRVGPQERSYGLNQKIPFWDKLWVQKDIASHNAQVKFFDLEQKRLDLIDQITQNYYEYVYLKKLIVITQKNMKLLQNFEAVAQSKYSSGLTENQDLLKVQVELGLLENELKTLKDLRKALSINLISLLNINEIDVLAWPNENLDDIQMQQNEDLEKIIENFKSTNPQLKSLIAEINKNKSSLKMAKRQYIPDMTLGIKTIETNGALNPLTVDSGKDPLMVSVSFNVPIWFNRLKAQVRKAEYDLEAISNKKENVEDQLVSKIAMADYQMKDASRQVSLYREALIPKAVQTLNAIQSGYESGKNDFLSLIDAQRMLLNFQKNYYRQIVNYYKQESQLNMLIGQIPNHFDTISQRGVFHEEE